MAKTDDVFERSKIELVYNYSVAFFIIGTIFYVGLMVKELWLHVGVITIAFISLFLIPFVLKYTQSVKKASIFYIIQQILVSCGSMLIQQGQQDITGGLWMAVFVIFSLFLFGRKWGIFLIILFFILGGISIAVSQKIQIPPSQKLLGTPDEFLTPFILIVVIIWMFVKGRSQAEEQIKAQRLQLEISRKEIEIRNKDVTDSINYAKRIQYAVLPQEETIYRSIPLSFIYYKPKDIVSGDFFWFHEINANEYILVCADCTGHGVPGAFMTVIGSSLLNQTVIDNKIVQPSQILLELDKLINFTLKQQKDSDISVQDGMDLTLIKVNKTRRELIITSAKRPVIFIRNKELQEIKASKFSLGGMRSGEKRFEETLINYQEEDILYMFTDGYVDQFGGEKGKKYSSKRLRELFLELHRSQINDQKNLIASTISNWQGDLEQIDDMLVMGIKF